MSRLTRLVLAAVLIELFVVALLVPVMQWDAISENLSGLPGVRRLDTVRLIITFVAPFVLAAAWAVIARRLGASDVRLSPPHRGYAEAGLLTVAFFLMAYQGWFASHLGENHIAHASRERARSLPGWSWRSKATSPPKRPRPPGRERPIQPHGQR
jgi:hypothetical protein